jgi:hypothetical protein
MLNSFAQTNFLGGEISKFAQGRFDRPDYRTCMNVCLNGYPLETGAWVRRPGTRFVAATRGGAAGKLIRFDFQANSPYNMEFTAGHLRFFAGASLVTTNHDVSVASISTDNPCVVTTSTASGWSNNDQVMFKGLGQLCPTLQNRVFQMTPTGSFTFTLSDPITGDTVDGSTLGWSTPSTLPTIARVLDFSTAYINTLWSSLRSVQAENQAVLLSTVAPYVLTVATQPTSSAFATFTLSKVVFSDGPYLDPPSNGAVITPSAKVGVITATISFTAYDSSKSYRIGDIVSSGGSNYQSLTDGNYNNTPASSPTQWTAITTVPGVNNGSGFLSTDVGRAIRLYSEPQFWTAALIPAVGDGVTYNGVYWRALTTNAGKVPGTDTTNWVLDPTLAIWVWGTITAVSSTTVASVQLLSPTSSVTTNRRRSKFDAAYLAGPGNYQPGPINPQRTDTTTYQLLYTTAIRVWRLGLFSDTTGYPTCGTYADGRLFLSGVVGNRIDGSVSNDLFNFAPTGPDGTVADNNAVSYVFNAPDVNSVLWMKPNAQGISAGTVAGEWLVRATGVGGLTPTNVDARRVTNIGCANIEPALTGLTMVFVQRWGRKLMEYFADVYSGKYTAPNLSERAKHLTETGIAEIAYQQELTPIVWMRREDGELVGATYKREVLNTSSGPTFIGWHRHELGSGRVVESFSSGPNIAGSLDALSMITNDETTGIRHVEIMTDLFDEGADISTAWFLDNAVQAPVTSVTYDANTQPQFVIQGLWHQEGATVAVFAGGLDLGDYTVTNGTVTVPFGSGINDGTGLSLFTQAFVNSFTSTMPCVVGYTYNSDGQIVRPLTEKESATPSGPSLAKLRRGHKLGVLLQDTKSISFGTDFTSARLQAARFMSSGGTVALTPLQMFSGIYQDTLKDNYSFDSMACWRSSRAYPANVLAISPFQATQDV